MKLLVGNILSNKHRFSEKLGLQWYDVIVWPIILTIITVSREDKERKIRYDINKGVNWDKLDDTCAEIMQYSCSIEEKGRPWWLLSAKRPNIDSIDHST